MSSLSLTPTLLTRLLLTLMAFTVLPVRASEVLRTRTSVAAPAPPRIAFRTSPHWVTIPGTTVYRVRDDERPNYDMLRYGSQYYIYDGGYWYRSNRWSGPFVTLEERRVPVAFYQVPQTHWRNYPPGWSNPKNPHSTGRHDNGRHKGGHAGHGNH